MKICRFFLVGRHTIRRGSRGILVVVCLVLSTWSFYFTTNAEATVILSDPEHLYLNSQSTSFSLPGAGVSADGPFILALVAPGHHRLLAAPPSDSSMSHATPLIRGGPPRRLTESSSDSEESDIWSNKCGQPPAGADPTARSSDTASRPPDGAPVHDVINAHIARIEECQRFLQYAMEQLMMDVPPTDLDPPVDGAFAQFAPGIPVDENLTGQAAKYTVANTTNLAMSRVRGTVSRAGWHGANGQATKSNKSKGKRSKTTRINIKEFIIDFFSNSYTIVFILLFGTTVVYLNMKLR